MRAVLGDAPRRRDLLIEHLHLIQDRFGHLSAAHLAALAAEMRLPQTEVYEVATFYAHFDVVKEDEAAPPEITVRVCDSLTCSLYGAASLLSGLKESLPSHARVVPAPCMGRCQSAPVAEVGHNMIDRASAECVLQAVSQRAVTPQVPDYEDLKQYRIWGGYELLAACRNGERDPESLITMLEESGLRGLGGAGFPAGRKWRFVLAETAPRLLAVNADEGEPGTFKDRHFLESTPHRVLEGMLIAAWVIGAKDIYFYLRDEYPAVREILRAELAALEDTGLNGGATIHLRRGAGAYVCGEESAMLESIEGKRGLPRHKPPFPAQVGLFGRPTLSHNVETLYWIRDIVERGPDWFSTQGREGHPGPRQLFSVRTGQRAGRQNRARRNYCPRAHRRILRRHGRRSHAESLSTGRCVRWHPARFDGGYSARLRHTGGTRLFHRFCSGHHPVGPGFDPGCGAKLMHFFEDESCGQCTPCRAGTEKASKLLAALVWDQALLTELSKVMTDASICGLGQAAPNPLLCAFRYFADEIKS